MSTSILVRFKSITIYEVKKKIITIFFSLRGSFCATNENNSSLNGIFLALFHRMSVPDITFKADNN